jgi:hypothetical protein
VHTDVWERIRVDQTAAVDRDITARGVVSYIEHYVRSIQEKSQ